MRSGSASEAPLRRHPDRTHRLDAGAGEELDGEKVEAFAHVLVDDRPDVGRDDEAAVREPGVERARVRRVELHRLVGADGRRLGHRHRGRRRRGRAAGKVAGAVAVVAAREARFRQSRAVERRGDDLGGGERVDRIEEDVGGHAHVDAAVDRKHPGERGGVPGVANLVVKRRLLRRNREEHALVGDVRGGLGGRRRRVETTAACASDALVEGEREEREGENRGRKKRAVHRRRHCSGWASSSGAAFRERRARGESAVHARSDGERDLWLARGARR